MLNVVLNLTKCTINQCKIEKSKQISNTMWKMLWQVSDFRKLRIETIRNYRHNHVQEKQRSNELFTQEQLKCIESIKIKFNFFLQNKDGN